MTIPESPCRRWIFCSALLFGRHSSRCLGYLCTSDPISSMQLPPSRVDILYITDFPCFVINRIRHIQTTAIYSFT